MKLKMNDLMQKKKLILKTHGLRNSSEVGLVILPESFYVKVKIEENGDFDVEFINSMEEQLFSQCHSVQCNIEKTPSKEELKKGENQMAQFIVDSLAQHLINDNSATYDTETHRNEWADQIKYLFKK